MRQTNFDNDEAVGYLADRLARLGVEDALAKAGAEPGAPVRIGTYDFDWQPRSTRASSSRRATAAPTTAWRRQSAGPPAAQRLAARKARRIPYEQREAGQTQPQLVDDFSDYAEDDE